MAKFIRYDSCKIRSENFLRSKLQNLRLSRILKLFLLKKLK